MCLGKQNDPWLLGMSSSPLHTFFFFFFGVFFFCCSANTLRHPLVPHPPAVSQTATVVKTNRCAQHSAAVLRPRGGAANVDVIV